MSNKIALITGGSRGLGRSAALALAKKNVEIIFTYHSAGDAAQQVVREIETIGGRAVALQLVSEDIDSFAGFAEKVVSALDETWGRSKFDILVNNAGIGLHKPFTDTSVAEFDKIFSVNVKGPFFLTQQLLPLIEDGGRILNISSGLSRFTIADNSAYSMSKGAIEVMTRYLAKELGGRNIAVNTLAPGATETDFGGGAVRDNAKLNAYVTATTAMSRAGLPDDIGGAVASILTGDSQWITAQRIEASGGQSI